MKRFAIVAMAALMGSAAMAQTSTLSLSTYTNSHVEKYDGTVRNVVMNRYMFTGWNTVCLPFSLSAEQINATFGNDCQVEALVSTDVQGTTIVLNFSDVKQAGMEANTPYIVYYTGESDNVQIKANETLISYDAAPEAMFTTSNVTVHFCGANVHTDATGFYGIMAADNSEVKFVEITQEKSSGFYPTRCYISVDGMPNAKLIATHNAPSSIGSVNGDDNGNAQIYNINGVRQQRMQKGMNIIDGKKVIEK